METYSVAERRNKTIKLLNEKGQASVSELSRMLNVSEVTIRKDLQYLEEKSVLFRTHGGAMKKDYLVQDLHFDDKGKKNAEEKRKIGERAAQLVENGDSLILDAGTTVMQLAKSIHNKRNLNVLTPAINIALEVMRIPETQVTVLGGMLRPTSAAVVGSYAEIMLRDHFCSKLFLAADGFDPMFGITTTNALEAHLNRMMIDSAQKTIVVIDSSKFGRRGLSRICGIEHIDIVITDSGVSEAIKKTLSDSGIEVLVV